jgi:hypothetical protein
VICFAPGSGLGCGARTTGNHAAPVDCHDASAPMRIASLDTRPSAIALRGATLVVADASPETGEGSIRAIDLGSGEERPLASGRSEPYALSVTARYAYWLDDGLSTASADSPRLLALVRAPLDASAPAETVANVVAGPSATIADGETVYFAHDLTLATVTEGASTPVDLVAGAAPLGLTTDGDHVYWTQCAASPGVARISKTGGAAEHVADAYCPIWLATDGTEVYFVDLRGQQGELRRAPAEGGASTSVAVARGAIAMDDRSVYYVGTDGLYRLERGSHASERLAKGDVIDIALDDSCVYWAEAEANAIFILRKIVAR